MSFVNRLALRVGTLLVVGLGIVASACEAQDRAEAEAVPTRVTVRVVSRDAKLIGSGVGGALVRVVDAGSGEVLAEGTQEGGTGDTQLIMGSPHARGVSIYGSEGAAAFLAELQLTKPTVVNIEALGPLGFPQAAHSAMKQMLLVPGKHVEGDGVVLELHGFIVEILSPEPLTPVERSFQLTARVRMMCGCPIAPGGMWNADNMEFQARLKADGAVVSTAPLRYAGETSMFTGTVSVPRDARDHDLTVEVLVSHPGSQNFGRHEIPLGS
jgi:hypothetical protein